MRASLRGACLVLACAAAGPAIGQLIEKIPPEMEGVGIDDKSGDQVPLDLRFRDEEGRAITLAEVFDGSKPVLLSLNYSDCPMLCTLQLSGLVTALREVELSAGRDYTLVSVSVDPLETTVRAKQTEQKYLREYERAGSAGGFRFLTGNQENIRKLADAVGFRYKYVPDTREYSHAAAEMVCSPEGMISRYLYGVAYDPQTVRLSLVEAAGGRVGTALDRIILFCFHYDETKGRYGPTARRVMSLGAGVTVVALAAGLAPYWLARGSRPTNPSGPADHDSNPAAAPPEGATEPSEHAA